MSTSHAQYPKPTCIFASPITTRVVIHSPVPSFAPSLQKGQVKSYLLPGVSSKKSDSGTTPWPLSPKTESPPLLLPQGWACHWRELPHFAFWNSCLWGSLGGLWLRWNLLLNSRVNEADVQQHAHPSEKISVANKISDGSSRDKLERTVSEHTRKPEPLAVILLFLAHLYLIFLALSPPKPKGKLTAKQKDKLRQCSQ